MKAVEYTYTFSNYNIWASIIKYKLPDYTHILANNQGYFSELVNSKQKCFMH